MESAVAESVAKRLLDEDGVVETYTERSRGEIRVVCVVDSERSLDRVKKTLWQYPLYVLLEVDGNGQTR